MVSYKINNKFKITILIIFIIKIWFKKRIWMTFGEKLN